MVAAQFTKRLMQINGLAIFCVVANHATGWGVTAMFWWAHRYRDVVSPNFDQVGSLTYDLLLLIKEITLFSVPAFIFVSGYFAMFGLLTRDSSSGWKYVKARLIRIITPYLIWSVLVFIINAAQGNFKTAPGYIQSLLLGETIPGYYFIPAICQLFILIPVLVQLVREHPGRLLWAAAIVQAISMAVKYLRFSPLGLVGANQQIAVPPWFFPNWIFYFVLGMVVYVYLDNIKSWLVRRRFAILVGTVFLFALTHLEARLFTTSVTDVWIRPDSFSAGLYAIGIIFSLLAFSQAPLPVPQVIDTLARHSYQIFLLHGLVIQLFARLTYHIAPRLFAFPWIFQLTLILVGVAVPLLLINFSARSPGRRFHRFVFG